MLKHMKYLLFSVLLLACTSGPKKIQVGKDQCAFCRMTIMEENFAAEVVTAKGKVYTYDDLKCLQAARESKGGSFESAMFYGANYLNGAEFLDLENAYFVKAEELRSPMAGNVAIVKTADQAELLAAEKGGVVTTLADAFD